VTRPDGVTSSCPDAGRSFPAGRLALLKNLEDWHFWFDGRRRLVVRLLANARIGSSERVIDVGCGTGAMVATLRRLNYHAIGVDPLAASGSAGGRTPILMPLLAADARAFPFPDGSVGAAVTLDVLEHTDDVNALRELHRILKPGGSLVLTVPALPGLWSHHDRRAGHLRRYTRAILKRRVREAGFLLDECHYYQCLLLPVLAAARMRPRAQRDNPDGPESPSRLVNSLFKVVTRIEVLLSRWISWPIGSTLAIRCRKPRV
jgi:SAM-dependent methyltransferase